MKITPEIEINCDLNILTLGIKKSRLIWSIKNKK